MASLATSLVPAFLGGTLALFIAPHYGWLAGVGLASLGVIVTLLMVGAWERQRA